MSAAPELEPGKPVALIYRAPLFNASETFIQAQAASLERYQPLFVGTEAKGHATPALAGRLLIRPTIERLRSFAPRLVHAHFATDGLAALGLAEALDVPLVTTLHGYDVSRSRLRMLLSGRLSWMRHALLRRRLIGRGSLFLAVSEAIRHRAIAQGFPAERVVTHYIGADVERLRPGTAPEPGLILHVGRLVEKKGTVVLLEAFAAARRSCPEARLAIVGDGPLRRTLERKRDALGLGSAAEFLGARPPGEVAEWMRRAWVLAAPSVTAADGDSEGLPMVLVEGAACGLPAVATRHSGIPEAVIDGQTGLLVPERDVAALADGLAALLSNPELRNRMSRAARALAEQRFDLARQTALLEDSYDRLVAERSLNPPARSGRAGAGGR